MRQCTCAELPQWQSCQEVTAGSRPVVVLFFRACTDTRHARPQFSGAASVLYIVPSRFQGSSCKEIIYRSMDSIVTAAARAGATLLVVQSGSPPAVAAVEDCVAHCRTAGATIVISGATDGCESRSISSNRLAKNTLLLPRPLAFCLQLQLGRPLKPQMQYSS